MAANTGATGATYFDSMDKLGKTHWHFLIIATIAYFFDQMDMGMFSYVAPAVMADLGFDQTHLATINSMSFWGMCFGGLIAGWMGEKFGRKNGLLMIISVFSLAQLANIFTPNLYLFCFFRFLVGFGAVGMLVIAMTYISEMMPSQKRGKYQALTIAIGSAGLPMCSLFATVIIPMGDHTWRYVFLLGALGILLVPIGMKWLKESPRWLVSKGRIEEAEKIVSECTGLPCDLSSEKERIQKQQQNKMSVVQALKIMFDRRYLRTTSVVMLLAVGITVGNFFLSSWNTVYQLEVGWEYQAALFTAFIIVFGNPLGDLLASMISDKGGRRIPIAICCIVAGVGYYLAGQLMENYHAPFTVVMMIRGMCVAASMTMLWTYCAESFPTAVRSNVSGIILSFARGLTAFVTPLVPIMYAAIGIGGLYAVNALMFIIPAILVLLFGKSTAGKTLEQIEAEAMG